MFKELSAYKSNLFIILMYVQVITYTVKKKDVTMWGEDYYLLTKLYSDIRIKSFELLKDEGNKIIVLVILHYSSEKDFVKKQKFIMNNEEIINLRKKVHSYAIQKKVVYDRFEKKC